jgi:hypothetical protein
LLPLCLIDVSCSGQNIRNASSLHYDSVRVFPDSVVYTFCSGLTAWAENQRTYPLHFRISLPPKLLSTYASGMESFGFQYAGKQVIYVWLDYKDSLSVDTSYRISREDDIEELLLDKLNMINDAARLDIENNPYKKERETWIIKKGKATILLYNIDKRSVDHFLAYISSFAFLRP